MSHWIPHHCGKEEKRVKRGRRYRTRNTTSLFSAHVCQMISSSCNKNAPSCEADLEQKNQSCSCMNNTKSGWGFCQVLSILELENMVVTLQETWLSAELRRYTTRKRSELKLYFKLHVTSPQSMHTKILSENYDGPTDYRQPALYHLHDYTFVSVDALVTCF